MYYIHTIEVNGQTLTRTTNGYKYEFGVPSAGRKIEAIRASLQSEIDFANPELVSAKIEAYLDADERTLAWSAEQRADYIADQTEQRVSLYVAGAKRAQKQLKALEHFAPGTFVWEKASWHHSFEAANKAARGNRSYIFKAQITEK